MQHAQAKPLSQVIAQARIKEIASKATLAAQECPIDTVSQVVGVKHKSHPYSSGSEPFPDCP